MSDGRQDEKGDSGGSGGQPSYERYRGEEPAGPIDWRAKLASRDEKMGFLRTALRYWYGGESYGSEKRKEEA